MTRTARERDGWARAGTCSARSCRRSRRSLFVLTFNFFLFRVLPGDPIGLLARSERLDRGRHRASSGATLGLDQPLPRSTSRTSADR